jgi:hypothetical protein
LIDALIELHDTYNFLVYNNAWFCRQSQTTNPT